MDCYKQKYYHKIVLQRNLHTDTMYYSRPIADKIIVQ